MEIIIGARACAVVQRTVLVHALLIARADMHNSGCTYNIGSQSLYNKAGDSVGMTCVMWVWPEI